jgi:hypothetical protein
MSSVPVYIVRVVIIIDVLMSADNFFCHRKIIKPHDHKVDEVYEHFDVEDGAHA